MSDTIFENERNDEAFDQAKNADVHDQLSLFVNLDGFEGPIDLLLSLSREQKVDLTRISILPLAQQYLEFIRRIFPYWKLIWLNLCIHYQIICFGQFNL